jgi:hypothetical protein
MAPDAFNRSGSAQHTAYGGQGTPCALPSGHGGASGQLNGLCGEIGLASAGYALASALGSSSLYVPTDHRVHALSTALSTARSAALSTALSTAFVHSSH